MPRTIGLVAILVFAAVAAVAGAVTPPPPPPPIATVVVPPPVGVPGAAAVAVPGVPPPAQRRVSFSIADAAPAEEGKPLTFRITRSGDDGRAHEVRLNYDKNPSLLVNPPPSIRFEPGEPAQKDLVLQTAPGLPGGGNNDVEVRISSADDGAFIGVPRVGTGTITDVPLPPAVTYGLQADPNAKREQNVSFTLTRTGSLTPADVPYRVEQDQMDLFADAPSPPQARFLEGERSTQIIVPAAQFSPCGGSLTVRLSQPDGTELSATAEFSEPVPDRCNPPPRRSWWDIMIDDYGLDLVVLVLVGIALTGAAVAHFIFKPPVEAGPTPEPPVPHGDDNPMPETQADVEPSLEINPGAASFQPLEEPVSRWPKFSADVTIEPGDSYVTQPLPALEPDDG
jgi:hypothetical protein